MQDKWDEVEALPSIQRPTLAAMADQGALAIAKAQDLKAEVSKCSKMIHANGGEDAVWQWLEEGLTVLSVCQRLGVSASAMDRWVNRGGEERRAAYARARARGAQSLAEQTISIADEATPQDVQVAKLRIEQRWKMASKLNPTDFGDRPAEININLGDVTLAALRKREITDVIDVTPVNESDADT